MLENLVLILAAIAILLGGFLYAYGLTKAIVEGPGYEFPNVQHISTYPHPARS